MYFVFYKTSDVFAAEECIQEKGIQVEIVPTPVQDKAYCGVCVQVSAADLEKVQAVLAGMKYQLIS